MPVAAAGSSVTLAHGPVTAVAASDFSLPAGATTAVIGPNGSGKSTLLNALAGIMKPVTGSIEVLGRDAGEARRNVAYVMQATKINEVLPLTVREAVAMGRYPALGFFKWFKPSDQRAVARALDVLGITDLAGRHLTELSGGQRQRVFVAQGLVQEAAILLLDEPFTGLDLVSREWIARAIDDELRAGRTVVATTHDIAEANRADHVVLMAGRVLAEGPPEQVITPALLSSAYGVGILHYEDGSMVLDDPHHGVPG